MEDQLIILRIKDMMLTYEAMRGIRNSVLAQRETGLIVLPDYIEVILAPKNAEIKFEEEKGNE